LRVLRDSGVLSAEKKGRLEHLPHAWLSTRPHPPRNEVCRLK